MSCSVLPTAAERSKWAQQKKQQATDLQSVPTSLLSLFDEPVVADEEIRIYERSVAVGRQGSFEPSTLDRKVYEDYVASLMVDVRS